MPSPRFIFTPIYCDSGELHELQQAGRRDTTRSFGMRSKVCIGWAASAVTPGRRSLEWTSSGRATRTKSLLSLGQTKCHDVSQQRRGYNHALRPNPQLPRHSQPVMHPLPGGYSCTWTPHHDVQITHAASGTQPSAPHHPAPRLWQRDCRARSLQINGGLRRGDRVAGRVSRHCH